MQKIGIIGNAQGYFGHLVTIFVINFVGYKEGKLVEEGSAGIANDPKASTRLR